VSSHDAASCQDISVDRLLSGEAKLLLYAAYGNATTEIEAYSQAKVPKERTYIIGKHAGEQGTVAIPDYPSLGHLSETSSLLAPCL
jgi:phosphatidate phosphatase PAH1